jgi:hypothetical protein
MSRFAVGVGFHRCLFLRLPFQARVLYGGGSR